MSSISKETLQRLPGYLRHLKELQKQNIENVSSNAIAEVFQYNPVQVRKDFASIAGEAGKPKTGFSVNNLISDISEFLGYNNINEAVLVGVGNLGHALLSYSGFKNYGLEIVAAFDVNPEKTLVHGHRVLDVKYMSDFVKRFNILIGIITVPQESAQAVCDMLITAGIKAIWNFSPTHLDIPNNIAIMNVDMASSLAVLSQRLSEIMKNEK
ncbi:MAG TPA: redox-sensing transcriptional repressor Rex [Clostridia bacterium]|nr:redox-sensing transcriptional repressor Rex [Clostridia bacterium]